MSSFINSLGNEPIEADNFHTAYAEFLATRKGGWEYYITQTFRTRRNDQYNCASALWGVLDHLGFTRAFVAAESHRLGGIHLHSIVAGDYDWHPQTAEYVQEYLSNTFGWSKVSDLYSSGNGLTVSMYCSKYVTKGNEFFLYGDTMYWV